MIETVNFQATNDSKVRVRCNSLECLICFRYHQFATLLSFLEGDCNTLQFNNLHELVVVCAHSDLSDIPHASDPVPQIDITPSPTSVLERG